MSKKQTAIDLGLAIAAGGPDKEVAEAVRGRCSINSINQRGEDPSGSLGTDPSEEL